MKHHHYIVFLFLILVLLITPLQSCKLRVPVDDMSNAKISLSRAYEARGEKYAPDEVQKAEELLYNAHQDVQQNDMKQARENSIKSLEFSRAAIQKSPPLRSHDTLENAKKSDEEKSISKKTLVTDGVYTVQYNPRERDCLWRIARKVYARPELWTLIYIANKNTIKDPDLIFPGQRLIIPKIPER
jgi:nucleoid-associated protein YgaU